MAKILIDTGLKSNIPILLDGELYFCQDTNELFIGYSGINTLLNSSATNGKSAYEIWLTQGNTGTETDFLNSLKGTQGAQGPKGDKGDPGVDADMSRVVALENKIGNYTLWVGTKAQYDSISTKDNNTIYFIKG